MSFSISCVSRQGTTREAPDTDLLNSDDLERIAGDTRAWIKRLRTVAVDGVTFRERFSYRGTSLWWFTELYLHKTRTLERAIRTMVALERAIERHEPAAITLTADDPSVQTAAQAFARARGVRLSLAAAPASWPDHRWASYQIGMSATLSRLRPSRSARPPEASRVAAFVHTAFWRRSAGDGSGEESYIGPVLDELGRRTGPGGAACVGIGPRRNFRARRWWDPILADLPTDRVIPIEQLAPRRALRDARTLWKQRHALARQVTAASAMREAAQVSGCDLWSVLEAELNGVARLQWPWSARAMDEAAAAIDVLSPAVVMTYAEAGGWGRALMVEARRRGIPSVGLQHGFIYRHWLNYCHEPDEIEPLGTDRGFPFPDRTLLFDGLAARHLMDVGHLPPDSLRITGSPRLDALARRVQALRATDRDAARAELGVRTGEHLLALTAKYTEIVYQLPELFEAVMSLPDVRLVVKTHPAETPKGYAALAAGHDRIVVAAADVDLARVLAAADVIVTRNSTVAIDGLILGVPALVVGLPSNLSPFVGAGVMLGTRSGGIRRALETVLYDRTARCGLLERAAVFAAREGISADGGAAARAVDEILALI